MKLMFASDIHGSSYYAKKLKEVYEKENADKLILLGDLLYHGPRNDLSMEYDTKQVANILNEMKDDILCVRGNCDAEVDQMMLEFPIMADYAILYLEDKMIFLTHGHLYNKQNMPKLKSGDILIHGHTHVQTVEAVGENIYINPGSVSLPKNGNPNTYMIYEDGKFKILDFMQNVINEYEI